MMLDLEAIEARCKAATPAPWAPLYGGLDVVGPSGKCITSPGDAHISSVEECMGNGQFIAHAREDVPTLIAEVRRLRALLEAKEVEDHG